MSNISIIGGGLAGLVSALLLKRAGHNVLLIERKTYPFHRVCGEYISNEVRPFMERHGFLPDMPLPQIKEFLLSGTGGKMSQTKLDLGGFGVSRFTLDNHLYELAKAEGVKVAHEKVLDCTFASGHFKVKTGPTNTHSRCGDRRLRQALQSGSSTEATLLHKALPLHRGEIPRAHRSSHRSNCLAQFFRWILRY